MFWISICIYRFEGLIDEITFYVVMYSAGRYHGEIWVEVDKKYSQK